MRRITVAAALLSLPAVALAQWNLPPESQRCPSKWGAGDERGSGNHMKNPQNVLRGARLEQYQDIVVGLPRAFRDHLNFQMAFGPDGAIYFCQGSMTSVGWPL